MLMKGHTQLMDWHGAFGPGGPGASVPATDERGATTQVCAGQLRGNRGTDQRAEYLDRKPLATAISNEERA